MANTLLFDVNETLLDLSVLQAPFEKFFGEQDAMGKWFAQLLHSSLVVTLTKTYTDFGTLAGTALEHTANIHGVVLTSDQHLEILNTMRSLPPHPEVPESLERLRASGFRLATLTNSSSQMLSAQMAASALGPYFEQLISVEEVRRFKPAPETYQIAAEKLGVNVRETRLIAAHDWDVFGALRAGCQGAFVSRPGKSYNPHYEKPEIIGGDLREVTNLIIETM